MLKKLKGYIDSKDLCASGDRLLLAVSGGIDSVVMLDLMVNAGYNCSVAHCNFQLRGKESEHDMDFVVSLGEKYRLKTHIKRFETSSYASSHGISIQMAARDLRYNWFNEIASQEAYDHVAIAHNADDNIETFFLNLIRGTGLSGITGMPAKAGIFIRPVLWAGRNDIEEYCSGKELSYREDSSNIRTSYKRNFLRHEILPLFEHLNPSFFETMGQNMENIRQAGSMLQGYFTYLKGLVVSFRGNETRLSLKALNDLHEPQWFLHRYLSEYGFTPTQTADITGSLNSGPGRKFVSDSHMLLKDREFFILVRLENKDTGEYMIYSESGKIKIPLELFWETIDAKDCSIDPDPRNAYLDASTLEFPLKLRKWKEADSFFPLGMKSRKKLSDFFIDNKFSMIEKENTWLLVSGKDIVWIIGHRIDNRYRVKKHTGRILHMKTI